MRRHRDLNMCAEVLGPARCYRLPLPGRERCRVHEEQNPEAEMPSLDRIADVVLAYRPKPKTKAAKRRIRRKKRLSRK